MDIPLKGNLSDYPVARIFISLNKAALTGILSVTTERFTKKVYFQKGDAIFAASTLEDDRLGEMLLKAGKINLEQYDRSVELLKKTGKRQGTILVELGYLTPKELFWSVKYQVREIIYSLFNLDHGEYELLPGPLPTEEVITLKMSIGNLIYEGIRRITNWSMLKRQIPDNLILRLSSNPLTLFQDIEFSDIDKKILTLVDGKKTVKQIIDNAWVSPFEALKTLYTLYALGIIEEVKPREEEELVTLSIDEIFKPVHMEEDLFIKRVNEFYKRIGSMNYLEILGISEEASTKEITKRYFELTREYHPDKSYNYPDPALKERLLSIVKVITEAYNTLKDPSSRQRYIKSLKGESTVTSPPTVGGTQGGTNVPPCETPTVTSPPKDLDLKKAISLIKAERYSDAITHLQEIIKAEPGNAEARNYLALAYMKKGDYSLAQEAMLSALRIKPSSEYYTNLGLIYIKMKALKDAEASFQKALELNPSNEKAKKYLERIKTGR